MASHVFSRSYRLRPRHGHIALYGLGATIGDNQNIDTMPDASRASIVGPEGVPPSDSAPVDVAQDIPAPSTVTGSDVTPPQVAYSNVTPVTPSSQGYAIDPVTGQPIAKQDMWYMARRIAPWAIGGTVALALAAFAWRRMRRRGR